MHWMINFKYRSEENIFNNFTIDTYNNHISRICMASKAKRNNYCIG